MQHTITLPSTLYSRLEKLANESRQTPLEIAKQAIVNQIALEEWQLAQIDAGLADIEAGRVISHEAMLTKMELKIGRKHARKKAA